MDFSPLLHALCAVGLQLICWLLFDDWSAGALIGCTFFLAREHTQAEYRWIAQFGNGRRVNMPWWGGFDRRAWNMASVLDWLVPVVACSAVWLAASILA